MGIELLGSWPGEWDVRFKLHAPFDTLIEGEYAGGRLLRLNVTPEYRRNDIHIHLELPYNRKDGQHGTGR